MQSVLSKSTLIFTRQMNQFLCGRATVHWDELIKTLYNKPQVREEKVIVMIREGKLSDQMYLLSLLEDDDQRNNF